MNDYRRQNVIYSFLNYFEVIVALLENPNPMIFTSRTSGAQLAIGDLYYKETPIDQHHTLFSHNTGKFKTPLF